MFRLGIGGLAAGLALALGAGPGSAWTVAGANPDPGKVGFAAPQYLDQSMAGGEPFVIWSDAHQRWVYSSHEGTTHFYRGGATGVGTPQFLCSVQDLTCYQNHVNIWTTVDPAGSWQYVQESIAYAGFSDPDLTADEAGNIYDTGIDLVNDALFSSPDGGLTWPTGTPQCTEGDRPWLAGGRANEVFLSTDLQAGSMNHAVFRSVDKGASCQATEIDDPPGLGKLYFDPSDGSLIEAAFRGKDSSIGYSRLASADAAFDAGSGSFVPTYLVQNTTVFAHWPAIALDKAGNLYIVWDTDDRDPKAVGGCSGAHTPLPNHIMLLAGRKTGPGAWTFGPPIAVDSPPNAHAYWPWIQAGNAGDVSVVWYRTDKLDDLDCDMYNGTVVNEQTRIMEATIFNTLDAAKRRMQVVDAAGRVIHVGGVCQGGTGCVATGQDRRLGDFFTNALDQYGCVYVASGDTMETDALGNQLPTSRPILMRQVTGPSLGGYDCATHQPLSAVAAASPSPAASPSAAPAPAKSPLPNTGGAPRALALLLAVAALCAAAAVRLARRPLG